MRKLLLAAALLLSSPALAQQGVPAFPQTLPTNTVVGRLSSGQGPTEAIPFASLLTALFPNGSAAFNFNAASMAYQGSVNGIVTVQAQAAAGTWTLLWPTSQGVTGSCFITTASGSVATAAWTACGRLASDQTWTGVNTFNGNMTVASLANFTGTFQKNGVTQTFPAGTIVGTTDSQTLTNKSIDGSEINSGTISAARMPAGIYAQAVNTFTISHTIATTDCGNLVQMGTGSTGILTVTLPSVAGFTGPCPISIINSDTTVLSGKLLSGFPAYCLNSNYYLFPGQTLTVQIANGAWVVTGCPERYVPVAALLLLVNNSTGSDTTGDGLVKPFATIAKCLDVIFDAVDYAQDLTQPTCGPQSGQTFVESDTVIVPPHGTNTINITGQGGAFTWKPSGSNPFALLAGNGSNVQLTNVTFSGTGTTCFSGGGCNLVQMHNSSVIEPLAGITCTDTGAGGTCFWSDINTSGSAHLNVDNGLSVSGTIGTVVKLNNGGQLLWNSTLTAVSSPTIAQIFAAQGAGTQINIAGNFAVSGVFGGARQWAILNSAVLCNASAVAVPGSTSGISTAATFAAGIIVNSGVSAGGC